MKELIVNAVRENPPFEMADIENLAPAEIEPIKDRLFVAAWADDDAEDGVDWLIYHGEKKLKERGRAGTLVSVVHVESVEVAEQLWELFDESPPAKLEFVEEGGDLVLYVEIDGKRIAKRYSGQNWIALEPGYTVRGSEPGGDYNKIEIEYRPDAAMAQ
jgi:hypothetical protein